MKPGDRVRFLAHGPTGMPYTVVTRDGGECQLHDTRNRVLANVPVELLEVMPADPRAWREVDELEAG